jgi:hypothetical protein
MDLSDCKTCQDLWLFYTQPDSTGRIDLETFPKAISTKCQRHKPLVEAFMQYCPVDKYKQWPEDHLIIVKRGPGILTMEWVASGCMWRWGLLLARLDSDSHLHHVRAGRILNPAWLDVDTIKSWKQQCLSSHGAKCSNPMKVWPQRPEWLIDVENRCIVPGNDNDKPYLALSYRWNKNFAFTVHKDEVHNYFPHNSLSDENASGLAPTIRHAMHLTACLGERYLWADAICIVHGDWDATKGQLNLMGAIYANAMITIVAADDDAERGIAGLKGTSVPRSTKQNQIPFGKEIIIVQDHPLLSDGDSSYYQRAWTYQEYHMSARKIVFSEGVAHWECECGMWHEDMAQDQPAKELARWADLSTLTAGFPDLKSVDLWIHWYCTRELTYEEDNLSAISGLLTIASRAFPGGFLYGLPEMYFDRGLCWKPHESANCEGSDLRRRKESDRLFENRVSQFKLPSWSWIGWQGRVNFGGDDGRAEWHNLVETIPITQWYTSHAPRGTPRRRIQSTCYEDRERYKNSDAPLPSGWTRKEDSPKHPQRLDLEVLWPEGYGGYYFEHEKMPSVDNAWYYPHTVTGIDDKTRPENPAQTAYLFCETKKGYVQAHSEDQDEKKAVLQDLTGREIGELFLHNRDQLELFSSTGEEGRINKRIEVVAICRQKLRWRGWHEEKRSWVAGPFSEDFINVLWIKWENEIAYRLASGQIKRREWETLELEDVSLVLG